MSDIAPARREIVTAAVTLGTAVGFLAVVFGVGAVAAGSSVAQACVMSLLVFTGASQFSLVSDVAAGGSGISALGGASLLAGRNAVYGLVIGRIVGRPLAQRLVAAQLTLDETTAMAAAHTEPASRRLAFWASGAALFVSWNVGTLIGAAAGSSLDVDALGLDAAFPASYVAMIAPHLRSRRGLVVAGSGAAICISLVPFTPPGVPILCAAAAILLGLPAPPAGAGHR